MKFAFTFLSRTVLIIIASLLSFSACGQGRLTVSIPIIYSNVKVANNWSPPTAINRQDTFEGGALGYGVNLTYSFRLPFIIRDKHISMNIGGGFFNQRFNIEGRPFDYDSHLLKGFFTDYYSYQCLQLLAGISYVYSFKSDYSLVSNLSYSWLNSFQQRYSPTDNPMTNHPTQVNSDQMNFGNMLILSIGINKTLRKRFLLGLNMVIPLYTRWRNDKIFGDDPTTFYHPGFSIGSSIDVAYRFE